MHSNQTNINLLHASKIKTKKSNDEITVTNQRLQRKVQVCLYACVCKKDREKTSRHELLKRRGGEPRKRQARQQLSALFRKIYEARTAALSASSASDPRNSTAHRAKSRAATTKRSAAATVISPRSNDI